MTASRRLLVRCPAKVNLHLEVLGRRPDGYHELRTLFAAAGVWDEIVLEAAPAGTLELTVDPVGAVPTGPDNLVLRAARALQRSAAASQGVRVLLRKRIPVAGGLGGGSSDAAAALVGLVALWGLRARRSELLPLAAELGADVPFFLVGGAAWGFGRGDEVLPLPDLPPWWVVLVPGAQPVPTAQVYAALAADELGGRRPGPVYHWAVDGGELPLAACRNDLEPTVVAHWPDVGRRLREVRETDPMLAMVSGSGGTVFGLFPSQAAAAAAAARISGSGALAVPLLSRRASVLESSAVEG